MEHAAVRVESGANFTHMSLPGALELRAPNSVVNAMSFLILYRLVVSQSIADLTYVNIKLASDTEFQTAHSSKPNR